MIKTFIKVNFCLFILQSVSYGAVVANQAAKFEVKMVKTPNQGDYKLFINNTQQGQASAAMGCKPEVCSGDDCQIECVALNTDSCYSSKWNLVTGVIVDKWKPIDNCSYNNPSTVARDIYNLFKLKAGSPPASFEVKIAKTANQGDYKLYISGVIKGTSDSAMGCKPVVCDQSGCQIECVALNATSCLTSKWKLATGEVIENWKVLENCNYNIHLELAKNIYNSFNMKVGFPPNASTEKQYLSLGVDCGGGGGDRLWEKNLTHNKKGTKAAYDFCRAECDKDATCNGFSLNNTAPNCFLKGVKEGKCLVSDTASKEWNNSITNKWIFYRKSFSSI